MSPAKETKLILGAVALVAASFFGGLYLGKYPSSLTNGAVLSGVDKTSSEQTAKRGEGSLDADFSLFWDAIKITKQKYFRGDEIDDQKLLYGAIRGAIGALGDPHSAFLEPTDAQKFGEDIQGNFGGIGAEIGMQKGQLIVVAPLKGSPAEKTGLKAGDKILKVDDTFTGNLTVQDAVKIIRGEIGTKVALLIARDGWDEPRDIAIERANIIIPTFEWEMISSAPGERADIAYLKLYSFNPNTTVEFGSAVFSALFKGTKGVVLDMRNNPGGFLDTAINIAGWFIQKGDVITKERFPNNDVRELRARGNSSLRHLPVVVLVNDGSASASEIVAGALRDHLGAKLVGTKTFGKGSVQELEILKDNSTLKLSVAEWLTPNGHSIEGVGLEPDVEVELSEDPEVKEDLQLKKALEVLRPQLAEGRAIPQIILEF
jgi:carboxyl-terminal processing protease